LTFDKASVKGFLLCFESQRKMSATTASADRVSALANELFAAICKQYAPNVPLAMTWGLNFPSGGRPPATEFILKHFPEPMSDKLPMSICPTLEEQSPVMKALQSKLLHAGYTIHDFFEELAS
jgi:hypothetical protein